MDDPIAPLRAREEVRIKGVRKAISDKLGAVWREAVHVTLHKEMDVSSLYERRAELPHSWTDYVYYEAVQSLKRDEFRKLNGHFDGTTLRIFDSIHLGLALDHPRGLIVPVIHGAEELRMPEFVRKRKDVMMRAKLWKHTSEDLANGTFTISNLGALGVDWFTPILNPPQVAILGLGRIRVHAVSWEYGAPPVPKVVLPLSLTVDHRIVDGADAAKWMNSLESGIAGLGNHISGQSKEGT